MRRVECLRHTSPDTAEAALRTAEESSVVGLIDGTPAKQFPNAANADGDLDILFDIEASLRAKTEDMKSVLESQPFSPELVTLGIARFIVSASDLLEALEGVKRLIECYVSDLEHSEEYQDVVKAIKKARGEE